MANESLLNCYKSKPCFLCRSLLNSDKVYNEIFKLEVVDDKCLSYSLPAFVVRILLEIPSVKLQDLGIDPVLVTCEPCSKAIQQAWKLYHQVLETTKAFRTVQKKIVEIFKTREAAPDDPLVDKADEENGDVFYQQCQQFANENSFNCFELPFIVQDVMKIRPSRMVAPNSPSTSESLVVKTEDDDDQDEYDDSQQRILLFLSEELPDTDLINDDIKEEQLSDYDDNDNDTADNSIDSSANSTSDDEPKRKKLRRTQKAPNKPKRKPHQGPGHRISKFDQLYPNYPKLLTRPSDGKFSCPEVPCEQAYKEKQKLQRHILIKHLKDLHKCTWPNCMRTFATTANLKSHLDRHNETPRWKCEQCNDSFYTANQLHAHKQIKHQQANQSTAIICEICGASFNCRDRLYVHRSTKHRSSKAETAGSGKKSKFEILHPNYILTKDLNGIFTCSEINCQKIYKVKRDMEDHIQTVHMNEKLYICEWPKCDKKSFETCSSSKAHQLSHKRVHGKCSVKTKQGCGHLPTKPKTRLRSSSQSLVCDHCGKSFQNNLNLKSHVNLFHEKTEGQFGCHLCEYRFVLEKHLKLHLFRKHDFSKDGFKPRKLERKKDTQCPVQGCRLTFAKPENLRKHMEKKHGGGGGGDEGKVEAQFKCKYCGKGFHLKCKLDHHHEIHENEKTKPYKCQLCGKGFATMAYLKYHQKHTHKMKLEDERLGRLTKD